MVCHCRASFQADSTASLPELVKNTCSMPSGPCDAMRSASSMAAGWATVHVGVNTSSDIWRSAASPISAP